MSFEGVISSLGASRSLDGSIDRVPDPPQNIWGILAFLQAKCEAENVEIISVFEVCGYPLVCCRGPDDLTLAASRCLVWQDNGGSHHGTMKREKFCTALKDNFSRCYFTQDLLDELTGHYGIGYVDKRGFKENVAWKVRAHDFSVSHASWPFSRLVQTWDLSSEHAPPPLASSHLFFCARVCGAGLLRGSSGGAPARAPRVARCGDGQDRRGPRQGPHPGQGRDPRGRARLAAGRLDGQARGRGGTQDDDNKLTEEPKLRRQRVERGESQRGGLGRGHVRVACTHAGYLQPGER